MYLISIYFDEKTNKIIQGYMEQVAEKNGNEFMLEGKVPPHITISAFESKQQEIIVGRLEEVVSKMQQGTVQWASIGAFLPYVLYVAPVLNEYLHGWSQMVYESIHDVEETKISPYYRPFQWLPHTTIGKKLSKEEMKAGFEVLQNHFTMFSGKVVKVGLAKTNPYQDIKVWEL